MLSFKVIGEGLKPGKHPWIFIHGLMSNSKTFTGLLNQLKLMNFNSPIYLVDLRNHGNSFWSDDCSLTAMKDDIRSFMFQENIESPRILAHSMGGHISTLVAEEEKVDKMLLLDVLPIPYAQQMTPFLQDLENAFQRIMHLRFENTSFNDIENELNYLLEGNQELVTLFKFNIREYSPRNFKWKANIPAIADNLHSMVSYYKEGVYEGEVEVIASKTSGFVTNDLAKSLKVTFPNFSPERHIQYVSGGHMVHLAHVNIVAQKILLMDS